MRIAIVDDQAAEARKLHDTLIQEFHSTHTDIHCLDIFSSAEALLASWQPDRYDLILLDIFMDGMTGMEAAHKIRQTDGHVHLVFCTTSNEFASESYSVGASYYLHKPYDAADVRRMITRVRPRDYELTRYVLLPDGQKLILRDILYTEYGNHVISIHRKQGKLTQTRMSQGAFEALLQEDNFLIPCSKGLVVNLYEVTAMEDDCFRMTDGSYQPISRRKSKEVQSIYHDFLFQKMRKEMLV